MNFIDAIYNETKDNNSCVFYIDNEILKSWSIEHVSLTMFSLFVCSSYFVEYFFLALGTHKWIKNSSNSSTLRDLSSNRCYVCSILLIVIVFFLFTGGILALGVFMEIEEQQKCDPDNDKFGTIVGYVFMAHLVFDFINNLVSCGIRIWMILHTYKIKAIWSREEDATVQLTEARVDELLTTHSIEDLVDEAFFDEYEVEYKKRGPLAKDQMLPFVSWFLIPWWHFLILSFVNPDLVLTLWTFSPDGHVIRVISYARYFYFVRLLINFTQLFVQHACVWRMNEYNQKYFDDMEERLLYK